MNDTRCQNEPKSARIDPASMQSDVKQIVLSEFDFWLLNNPAKDKIDLELNLQNNYGVTIFVTDLSGRVLKTVNNKGAIKGIINTTISIPELTKGFYFLTVSSGNNMKTIKFIKNEKMKTKNLLYSVLLIMPVLIVSCVKQPDIPDTTTDIEGTVTNAATGDSMPNYNVLLLIVPYADIHSTNNKTDTTVVTDAKGHYKIVRKLDLYKVNKYMINAEATLKYGPTTDIQEVTVGVKNIINLKIARQKNYDVINGIVSDLQNNKLNNIKIFLYVFDVPFNDLIKQKDTLSDSLGNFHFEFEWTDTVQLKYKVIIPQTDKYQASDDYWVKWGVDNYFNIVLKDR